MMRLGFGVTTLARGLNAEGIDGIGSYTRELMKIISVNEGVDLVPISYSNALPEMPGIAHKTIQKRYFAASAAISCLTGLPFPGSSSIGKKIDLLHATDHLIPNFGKVPVVATLMDAIPLSHPQWVSMKLRTVKNAMWRQTAKWATHVITISDYSRQEIEQYFDIPADKISVIPLGVDERWFHQIENETLTETRTRYGLPEKFILSVGTLQPRKNVGRVIEAYRTLPKAIRSEVALVIVGRAGWQCEELVAGLASGAYGSNVFWLKHLPDADLLALMKLASSLAFPSLLEGFGLPVLEAFAAGTPVITSKTTSLPEVAGDAALLVDPLDIASIAAAMQLMLEDQELANSLREKGYIRAREHTWERTASMTLDVYRKVLSGSC